MQIAISGMEDVADPQPVACADFTNAPQHIWQARARYYTITAAGRKQLGYEISSFDRVLGAIQKIMAGA